MSFGDHKYYTCIVGWNCEWIIWRF